jgi:hypothetical protein
MEINWFYVLMAEYIVVTGLGLFMLFKATNYPLPYRKNASSTLDAVLTLLYIFIMAASYFSQTLKMKHVAISLMVVATALYIAYSYEIYGKWTWHTTLVFIINSLIIAVIVGNKNKNDLIAFGSPLYVLSVVASLVVH